jgi:ribonuclease VapC
MMFVDASAIAAMLTREAEADAFIDLLDGAAGLITSPIAIFEATLGICRKRRASLAETHKDVRHFLDGWCPHRRGHGRGSGDSA